MYMVFLAVDTEMTIYPFQIIQIALLIANKAFIIISKKYSNFANIFLLESITKLSKYTGINIHLIELINNL